MTRHTLFILAATLIILAVLYSLPAAAQCDPSCSQVPEPPISSTASSTLYLPAVAANWHAWFTDSELNAAMRRAGYDPQVASMHTNCVLDPSAVPPILLRYTSCEQYLIGDQPTEGTAHYIWYVRLGDNIVHGLEVGG
jgi:hypothetical protein